jgi:outer membrane lipoprotein-sorting protein
MIVRVAALLFAPLLALPAQQVPDAAGLLARNTKALGNFSTVQIKTDVTMDMAVMGTPSSVSYTMSIQVARPAKFRIEAADSFTTISDGANTWMYIPMLKKYSKKATSSADLQEEMDSLLEVGDSDPQVPANAKVVRSEVLEVDGQPRDCWVVESRVAKEAVPKQAGAEMEDAVHSFWIDKQLGLMLQTAVSGKMRVGPVATDMKMKFTTRSIQLNLPLADSLFTFTPPADAREVAESEMMPGIPGEPAAKGMEPVSPDAQAAPPVPPPPEKAGPSVPGEPEAFVPNLHTLE